MQPTQTQRGFTIVELLVVIVVIAILAAITIVAFNGVQNQARVAAAQSAVSQASKAILTNSAGGNEAYPDSLESVGVRNSGSTTYEYSVNNAVSPRTFCVTATVGGTSYYADQTLTNPKSGTCTGHNGSNPPVAITCPTNFIKVPGSSTYGTTDFCVMKYEAKNVSGVATSQAAGTPWVSISQTAAATAASNACSSCRLMTDAEWMTIAMNVFSVPSNWSTGTVGSGYIYSGHNDQSPGGPLAASTTDSNGYANTGNSSGNQRRTLTLTNGEVIWDLAGNVGEWNSNTIASNKPGFTGSSGFVWGEYTSSTLNWNGLPSSSRPSGTLYDRTTGFGVLISNASDTTTRGFYRGGDHGDGQNAGIMTLALDFTPSYSATYTGFRVAR